MYYPHLHNTWIQVFDFKPPEQLFWNRNGLLSYLRFFYLILEFWVLWKFVKSENKMYKKILNEFWLIFLPLLEIMDAAIWQIDYDNVLLYFSGLFYNSGRTIWGNMSILTDISQSEISDLFIRKLKGSKNNFQIKTKN